MVQRREGDVSAPTTENFGVAENEGGSCVGFLLFRAVDLIQYFVYLIVKESERWIANYVEGFRWRVGLATRE